LQLSPDRLKFSEAMKDEKKKKIKTDLILKETSANYIRLIGDADRKARIMLVVNSIFLTLSVTLITKVIGDLKYGGSLHPS
jgi:hypothetical protein